MPTKQQIEAIIAALIATVIFGAGLFIGVHHTTAKYTAQIASMKADQAAYAKAITDNALAASQAARQQEQDWQQKVSQLDQQKGKEIADAQKQNDDLRARLVTGALRVRVKADCPAGSGSVPNSAGTPGMDDGAATHYAELDGQTASDLADIAAAGDKAIKTLDALQSYVQAITTK